MLLEVYAHRTKYEFPIPVVIGIDFAQLHIIELRIGFVVFKTVRNTLFEFFKV
ncbi:hypothetical protein HMPREF9999_00203 [Alloprevotella sp. oral taxon 473 str. F0040]|nr:hypothetical protein HMPREF9999_00203 [Alloprevotella sp. oral taxon 473 str. F0040]